MPIKKNDKVILCERGVSAPHTHKSTSRFLLDLQAIPAIKDNSCLPIFLIQVTHAFGISGSSLLP